MRPQRSRSLLLPPLLAVGALLLGPGCSSTAFEREQARLADLDAAMRAAAAELNAADVSAARTHLDDAEGLADSDYERRRIESLRQVIAGAELLRDGEGDAAAEAWSRIPSPTLRYEVQEKAAGVGIQVPDPPSGFSY